MEKLWEEKPAGSYEEYNPQSRDDICEASEYPERFCTYERLYKNLNTEELETLIEDARHYHWPVLDLRRCGLKTLPDTLAELPDLRVLVLGNLVLRNDVYGSTVMIGSYNFFPSLPESIGQLAALQYLNLRCSQINILPESIGQLSALRSLDLGQSQIRTLPESIGQLSALQSLNLWETKITALPESIGQLSALRSLDLGRSQIRTLPESIGQLSALQYLNLWETKITALPESIRQLSALLSLNLSGCHLKEIPYSLVQLGYQCNLEIVTDGFKRGCINLTGVILDEGDLSIFTQPREVIEEYYKNRIAESINECKVIFLGDGAAGKSSLIERMVHGKFKEGSLPTDGVKMTKWTKWPKKWWEPSNPLTLNGKPLTLRLLDFGGQEIMHSMHRCFLTRNTIYVVVCESRDDGEIDSVAARWMETVQSFAPDCPVILALNKSDLNPHVTVNERDLKAINPNYRIMRHTSAKNDNDPGVKELIDDIFREVPGCLKKMVGNYGFLGLKQALEDMKEDYILPERFRELCDSFSIRENLRTSLLKWFQELGVSYTYFTKTREVYVLNPAWLTNGIYRLILRTPNGGFLKHSEIRETLGKAYSGDIDPDKTYTAQEMEFILYVMEQFEISLEVQPFLAGRNGGAQDGIEMIPMKMHKTPPDRYDEFPRTNALHLRWEAGYLPNNLVHRLMIRKYPELDPDRDLHKKCVWRTGGWFRNTDGCQALVEMKERALDVYVSGEHDARVYMDSFRQEIQKILKDLNITAEEYVYYNTKDGRTGKVKYQTVLSRYRAHRDVFFPDLDLDVPPEILLRDNYLRNEVTGQPTGDPRGSVTHITNNYNAPVGQANTVEGTRNRFK